MSLRLKLNVILLLTSLLGLGAAALLGREIFFRHADQESNELAKTAMNIANALGSYTQDEVRPLLESKDNQGFVPQEVPAYATSQFFHLLEKKHPNLHYKEASNNPIKAANWATDWEADLIQWFKEHPDAEEFSGIRTTAAGPISYTSRPIRVSADCLRCHDTPAKAPKAMLERYGSANGFGWRVGDIAAVQILSISKTTALKHATTEYWVFLGSLAGVFLLIALVMNLLLHSLVIRPIRLISQHADQVSLGTLDLPELPVKGTGEIASLSQSFNRMQRSLNSAMTMLNNEDA